MSMDIAAVQQALIDWIADWNEDELTEPVTADTNLIDQGALDSMGLTGLLAYLEEQVDMEFDFDTFDLGGDITVRGLINHCVGAESTA